jgi:hypothetical protein
MSCEQVQELISSFLDRSGTEGDRETVFVHARSCRECGAILEFHQNLRPALRRMERARVPADLTAKLRVLASHERTRRLSRVSLSARIEYWSDRARLFFDNLMRPVAVPFAGGVISAITIFSVLLPCLTFQHVYADQMLFTYPEGEVVTLSASGVYLPPSTSEYSPRIERTDAVTPEAANVVELTIDQSGRVCDWSVSHGELTPDITNIIMFSQFSPATNLGLPISGKVKAVQIRSVQTAPIRVRS